MCQSAQLGQSGRTLQRDAGRTDGGIGVETDDTDAALSVAEIFQNTCSKHDMFAGVQKNQKEVGIVEGN